MKTTEGACSDLEKISQDLDAIKRALLGSPYDAEGLIKRCASMDRRLHRLEKIIDRSRFTLLGLTVFACSGVYELLKRILQIF